MLPAWACRRVCGRRLQPRRTNVHAGSPLKRCERLLTLLDVSLWASSREQKVLWVHCRAGISWHGRTRHEASTPRTLVAALKSAVAASPCPYAHASLR